jgi:outer membrane receptor protein involved in Fe transport
LRSLIAPTSIALVLFSAAAAHPSAPGVAGRIESAQGLAIERARVEVVGAATEVFSTEGGHFAIATCWRPCLLLVTHPHFQEQRVEVTDPRLPVRVVMPLGQALHERVEVTARGRAEAPGRVPRTMAATEVLASERPAPPSTLTEVVEGVPGVAENGQPGLFQTFSIRGVARQRVLTRIAGVPVVGERRAGVSGSFLDPMLMGAVEVLRGPASTYYGSGALGGVVEVAPRHFDGLQVAGGWSDFANENYQMVAFHQQGWSIGVVRRGAGEGRVADGTLLNTHLTQYSATAQRSWNWGERRVDLMLAPSYGRDLGKPTTEYPALRVIEYPEERHLLFRLAVEHRDWSLSVFGHPNSLETETLRPGRVSTTTSNEAVDFGAGGERAWTRGRATLRFGGDWMARRNVSATELERDLRTGAESRLRPLDEARQDELASFGALDWQAGRTTLQAGARYTWHRQGHTGFGHRQEGAWAGFAGVVRQVGRGVELTANLGSGLRFASLSERFFDGTTPRGGILGNPELEPERSLSYDLGTRWRGERTFLAAGLFRLEISDYIERVDLDPGLRTFVNLNAGTITGVELEGSHQLASRWLLTWSGSAMEASARSGQPLADIPSHRGQLGVEYRGERFGWRARWQHRAPKTDPGVGEQALPAAELLSAAITVRLAAAVELSVHGRNLLDELYWSSADELTPAAPGRAFGLGVVWSR